MDMGNLETINSVYNKFCDEESKRVYVAKMDLIIGKDEMKFLEWFLSEYKELRCPELDDYEKTYPDAEYILFGAGQEGKKAYKILKACGKRIVAWSDNNKNLYQENFNFFDGLPGVLPGNLVTDFADKTIIITVKKDMLQIYQQLVMMGFPREQIIISKNGFILGVCGEQYFDLFEANETEKEIFVDAGCWDGETSKAFVKWCGGKENYDKIYAFEPDENCWRRCEETFRKEELPNINFIKKGTCKKTELLYFKGVGRGSSSVSDKEISLGSVSVTSIDEVLNGDKVTFIKLDVEGSEMETLIGAQETIRKYRPKLAISVYHKPEDMWLLAEYVISLNPEYKLYLRHYTTCNYETVLYAI